MREQNTTAFVNENFEECYFCMTLASWVNGIYTHYVCEFRSLQKHFNLLEQVRKRLCGHMAGDRIWEVVEEMEKKDLDHLPKEDRNNRINNELFAQRSCWENGL